MDLGDAAVLGVPEGVTTGMAERAGVPAFDGDVAADSSVFVPFTRPRTIASSIARALTRTSSLRSTKSSSDL